MSDTSSSAGKSTVNELSSELGGEALTRLMCERGLSGVKFNRWGHHVGM